MCLEAQEIIEACSVGTVNVERARMASDVMALNKNRYDYYEKNDERNNKSSRKVLYAL